MIRKNDYPVFQPNQVLSHDQLNDLVEYFEPRDRETRSLAIGRGIICGLTARNIGTSIVVEPGAAITSAGYMIDIKRRYSFKFAADFSDKSNYVPFLNEAQDNTIALRELYEQQPQDSSLNPVALSTLDLSQYVIILFLHDYKKDLATCLVDNCDNLGAEQNRDWHLLLVKKDDALNIVIAADERLKGATSQAEVENIVRARYDLFPLRLVKPAFLSETVVNYSRISNAYHSICMSQINCFAQGLDKAYKCFGGIIGPRNIQLIKMRLVTNFNGLSNNKGLQYFYDHLVDLFDAYNEFLGLAQTYYASCSTWQQELFSHHIMLGEAVSVNQCKPTIFRNYFISVPNEFAYGGNSKQIVFLFDRMLELISHFKLDTTLKKVRITPENQGATLDKRAIPCFYDFSQIKQNWSYIDSSFCRIDRLPSYFNPDLDLLNKSLNEIDYFRIEGHLYRNRDEVVEEIEALRAQHNLAFKIQTLDLGELDVGESSGGCTLEEMRILYQLARLDCICFLEDKVRYFTNLIADDIEIEYKDEVEAQVEIEKQKKPTPIEESLKLNYAEVIDFSKNSLFETQAIISEIINRKATGEKIIDGSGATPSSPDGLVVGEHPEFASSVGLAGVTGKGGVSIVSGAKDSSAYGVSGPKKSKYETYFEEKDLKKESLPEGIKYITSRKTGIAAAKAAEDFSATYGKEAAAASKPIKESSTSVIVEAADIAMVFPKTKITDYFNFTKPALADRLLQELIGLMTKVVELLPTEVNEFDEEALIDSCSVIKDKAMSLQEIVEDLLKNEKYIVKGFEFGLIAELLQIVDSCLDERLKNIAELHTTQWEQASNSTVFSEFIRNHPGIEHRAGVPKGGTFILVSGTISKEKKKDRFEKFIQPGKYSLQPLANYQVYRGNIYEKMLRTASHFSPKAFTWTKLIDKQRTELKATTSFSPQLTSVTPTLKYTSGATSIKPLTSITPRTSSLATPVKPLTISPTFTVSSLSILENQKKLLDQLLKKIDADPEEMVLFDFCLPYISQMCSEIKYVVLAELKLYLPKESFCAGDSNSYAFSVYPPGGSVTGTGVKKVNETYYFTPAQAAEGEVIFTYTIGGHETQLASKVHPQPKAVFNYEVIKIDKTGAEVEFSNISTNGHTYAWNFGDGESSSDHSPVHTYDLSDQNKFTVSLRASSGADCVDLVEKEINLIPINFKLAVLENEFCANDDTLYEFIMEPAGGELTGHGITESKFSPASVLLNDLAKLDVPITYTVEEQTAVLDLTVYAVPTVDFTVEVVSVSADSATVKFSANAKNASSYLWDFGDGSKATTADTLHTYKLAGGTTVFPVMVSVQNGPCVGSAQKDLDLSPITFSLKVNRTQFCSNNNTAYAFNVSPAGGKISGPGIEGDKFKPSLVDVGTQTSRTVILQYLYGSQMATLKVTVYHVPELKFSHTLISQDRGFAVQFSNKSSFAIDYLWDFGDGSLPVKGFSPSHTYKAEGLYDVTLSATNPGCSTSIKQQVLLKKTGDVPVTDKTIPTEPINGLIKLLKSTMSQLLLEFGIKSDFILENHLKIAEVNTAGKVAEFAQNDTILMTLAKEYLNLAKALLKNGNALAEKQRIYSIQVYKLAMAVYVNILSKRTTDLKAGSELQALASNLLELTFELNKAFKISMVFTENFILQPPEAYKGRESLVILRKGLAENL